MASPAGSVVARMLLTALSCAGLGFGVGLFSMLVNSANDIPWAIVVCVVFALGGFQTGAIIGLVFIASRTESVVARMLLTALSCAGLGFGVGFIFPVLASPRGNIVPAMLVYSVVFALLGFLTGAIIGLVAGLRRSKYRLPHH